MRTMHNQQQRLLQHDDSLLAEEDFSLTSFKSDILVSTSTLAPTNKFDLNDSGNSGVFANIRNNSQDDVDVDSAMDFNSVMSEMSNFSWGDLSDDDASMSISRHRRNNNDDEMIGDENDDNFEYMSNNVNTQFDMNTNRNNLQSPFLIDNNNNDDIHAFFAFHGGSASTNLPLVSQQQQQQAKQRSSLNIAATRVNDEYDSDASSFCTAHSRIQQQPQATLPIMEPRCTIEQLNRQAANLSIEERDAIRQDIFGIVEENTNKEKLNYDSEGNEIDEEECIDEFYSELELILARGRKTGKFAYGEALVKCPKLVESESNPISFLRCESYNPKKAALRLIEYWDMRKEVFGEKRAFLPISLKAGGAMEEDSETIDKYHSLMNIIPDDNHGRTVIFIDKTNIDLSKDPRLLSALSITRYLWYVLHVALLKKTYSTQVKGIVFINMLPSFTLSEYDGQRTRLLTKSISSCLPVKVRCMHQIICNSFFANILLPIHIFFFGEDIKRRIQIHNLSMIKDTTTEKKEKEKLVQKLVEQFGFNRNSLPQSIGGTYKVGYKYKM